ncbi:hypothetical protein GWO43_23735 [candidate division KSB1 bacterium]|nr:hypothetical protein [candidate division KSB1 bacterium]NIS26988.1 hypothetical protein [candidate division KSB1 bacterium]NIT73828.1 hypothetical protein [candidate division KSB1 bacterium]NIU27733.1 hypothetical protein [candidate division KSB1 bacterium]NIU92072.1 hypothetical protein [candidate division KSB1 bacterium]
MSTTYHNTINRLTGTVIEGLYTVEETFRGEDFQFEVYLRSKSLSKSELQSILQYISLSGFGKDKSTGRGHFEFDEQDLVEFNIEDADNANGFVTLSSYVPDSEAPLNGHYDLLIKYPKLAGDFETAFDNVSSPFKHPVAMMRSGAVFHSYERNRPYGALVAGVHKQNNSIMQYGLAFPVGVQIEE